MILYKIINFFRWLPGVSAIILLLVFFPTGTAAAGSEYLCNYCGQPCRKLILTFRNFTYCSEECFAVYHSCRGCGIPLTDGAVTKYDLLAREVDFCRSCSTYDGCFVCLSFENLTRLTDNRIICASCEKNGIKTPAEAAILLDHVRMYMKDFFGLPYDHEIVISIADQKQIGEMTASNSRKLAEHKFSYNYQIIRTRDSAEVSVTDTQCAISVLSHCPAARLMDSLAHELAHDYLRHNCGIIENKQLEEGFAEAVAAYFSEITGNSTLNKLRDINTDPVYGAGYRMVREYIRMNGWQETFSFMQENSKPLDEAALENHK